MLSFLREQGQTGETAKRRNGKTANHQTAQLSNCPDVEVQEQENSQTQQRTIGEPQEYLTVAAQNKNVRKTTCLLAVFFGIGLLCLWFMIKKSTPQTTPASQLAGISTEEAQIEMAITQLTGVRSEMFKGIEKIVKKFYEFSDVQQVHINELVKNPFEREKFLGNVKESSDTEERDSDILLERGPQLIAQGKNMQLLSIMQTEQGNCCMIDDRILYTGDSIRGFKVHQISDSFVKLVPLEPQEKSLTGLEWDRDPPAASTLPAAPTCVGRRWGRRSKTAGGTQIILKLSE